MRIGLTGGIGCGKSTVGSLFAERGFGRIDSDRLVHELLANDAATRAEIEEAFGAAVIGREGVDRAVLGKLVFSDAMALQRLEGILHPKVRQLWKSRSDTTGNWVIEIPLLFEKNLQNNVDLTVCVFSDPATQLDRLESRGMSRTQALARMDRQMPVTEKAELADYVLLNDGEPSFLTVQVDLLISKIKSLHP